MNDKAKKKARQAELEYELCTEWARVDCCNFSTWLQNTANAMGNEYYSDAIELITLYEEE